MKFPFSSGNGDKSEPRYRFLFSVFDVKAAVFGPPLMFGAAGEAIRGFTMAVRDERSMISKFPGDYQLFRIGQFDELHGVLVSEVPPVLIVTGAEVAGAPLSGGAAVGSS